MTGLYLSHIHCFRLTVFANELRDAAEKQKLSKHFSKSKTHTRQGAGKQKLYFTSRKHTSQAMWELHSWLGGVHISTHTKEVSFVFIVFVSIFVNSYQITSLQIIDPVNYQNNSVSWCPVKTKL